MRFEDIILEFITQDLFAKEFVGAVGNLMELTAQRADVYHVAAKYNGGVLPNITWTRRRELVSDSQSELMRALQSEDESTTPVNGAAVESTEVAAETATDPTDTTPVDTDAIGLVPESLDTTTPEDVKTYETDELMASRKLLKKVIVIKNKQLDLLC